MCERLSLLDLSLRLGLSMHLGLDLCLGICGSLLHMRSSLIGDRNSVWVGVLELGMMILRGGMFSLNEIE